MFRTNNKKLIPKLYILNLIAKDEKGEAHLFLYTAISLSRQDAYIGAMQHIKQEIPELYEVGQRNNGFEIASYRVCTYSQLQSSFKKHIDKENIHTPQEIKIVTYNVAESVEPPEISKKSKLIKKIINKGTKKYLDKHSHKLDDFEIEYILDKIK